MSKTYTLKAQQQNAIAAQQIAASMPQLLTNISDHLNELVSLAPRNEYFAGNAVCTILGYTVVNQLLWAYRKEQAALRVPVPSIDIFNDGYADAYEQRDSAANFENVGHASLPAFNALEFKGVYKHMLRMQIGNTPFAKDFPVRMPNEILHDMQTSENDKLIAEAYAAQAAKEVSESRASELIKAEMIKQATAQRERNEPKNKVEANYVLGELQRAYPEQLDDSKWNNIPMWMQYKLSCSVFRQVVKAIAVESRVNPQGSHTRDRLLALCDAMMLELEAAARTAEVRLAFALERLDERHEIIAKKKEEQPEQVAAE